MTINERITADPFLPPVPRALEDDPEVAGYFRALNEFVEQAAAHINALQHWTTVLKQADETQNSSTTFADDAELTLPVLASETYLIQFDIFFDTAATPDFKFQFTGPSSPTEVTVRGKYAAPDAAADTDFVDTAFSTSHAVTGAAGTTGGHVFGSLLLVNGTNAGSVTLQWAQNTSDAADTTVLAGSLLNYVRVS